MIYFGQLNKKISKQNQVDIADAMAKNPDKAAMPWETLILANPPGPTTSVRTPRLAYRHFLPPG